MKDTKDTLVNNAKIEKFILDYMANPKLNTMKEIEGPAFDAPLVGFSLATDSYYEYYKNHIDPNFYRLPQEWLKSFYNQDFDPADISIISWVLPQTENTRNLASKQKDCPTMEWSKKGKAARYGSVIANTHLLPTKRQYTKWNEYCQAESGCQACIKRCPAGAITLDGGHNKTLCQKYHSNTIEPILKDRYNYEGMAVCGLCQTGVPCEHSIPKI